MNRITAGIDRVAEQLRDESEIDIEALDESLGLSLEELFAFQEAKSIAHLTGRITAEEAMTIYQVLGSENAARDGAGWPYGTTIAARVVVYRACAELVLAGRK